MERKVFTYKDVEEAKKYIGKPGVFGEILAEVAEGNGKVGELGFIARDALNSITKKIAYGSNPYPFMRRGYGYCQFFSPDPEPVEKWVPFTAEDDVFFMGVTVTAISNKIFKAIIVGCNSEEVFLGPGNHVTYQQLLDGFPKLDGSPCGKKLITGTWK